MEKLEALYIANGTKKIVHAFCYRVWQLLKMFYDSIYTK